MKIIPVQSLDGIFFACDLAAMDDKHPHAAAIDRIGRDRIRSHYNVTPRAIQMWRAKGVPKIHHNTMRVLAATSGVQVPELAEGEAK